MKKFVLFLLISSSVIRSNAQEEIKGYKQCFALGDDHGKSMMILREFEKSGKSCYLAVDPVSLETKIISAGEIKTKPASDWQNAAELKNSPYLKAIQTAKQQSIALQDAGISHGFPKEKGITLTIDLCPSHKALDRVIFTSLIAEFQKTEKPVPLALSITGKFMLNHAADIEWLKGLEKSGDLNITWTNHTFNHHYDPKIPLNSNFLLEPGTSINYEILATEVMMIQKGLVPSIFFRFPGLVSDQKLVDEVLTYGLIPIGTDAWLAKGQKTHSGSIVLIHGNGNEPTGVQDFIQLLKTEKQSVVNKQWLLYDLRESIKDEFK
ncbi:polysaccharide deacetylase family protein [Pedobacter caeni]|uniref:Polysaccharide deacetylase n=1 Tax=Pedobacter caeni TaxID=288992 RepID=A0A1M5GY01_9SPHI|nr:polysaccharide deacetylase [Pedobacter caeni]SHG08588.1 hypothetical protein SAMN04488522_104417 [Pedobacter caeni]